ncbi:MAG: alpha/beta hydrolase [Acidobacteria bacterium]|nr:alpha/beta hydrolase [Acidobacteriota bacterium]MBS1866438.1 alpha/beta hydrolase [Acidobacteriota bacterium]
MQDVWITAYDGTKLHAWWIPNERAQFTFLAFHGNAGNIAGRGYVYKFLSEIPANVLAVEYRGYGKSEGKPGEKDFYRDARYAYQFLLDKQRVRPENIISFGQSLGTTTATDLASQVRVGGLILEAPFTSIADMAHRQFPYLPGVTLLVYGQMDTKNKIGKVKAPILIVQCSQDPVIPPVLGQEVYAAAPSPKQLLKFDMSCHEESSLLAPAKYSAELKNFLSKLPATK